LKDRKIIHTILFTGSRTLQPAEGDSLDLDNVDLEQVKLAWLEIWGQTGQLATQAFKSTVHPIKHGTTSYQVNPFAVLQTDKPAAPGSMEEWPSRLLDCQALNLVRVRITNLDIASQATVTKVIIHKVI